VILYTGEAIEIVLNALAFTFIARIDEDLTKSGWYDPEKRWVTAGAQTVAMQTHLKLRYLSSPKLFSQHFDIHEELLLQTCDQDRSFLHNKRLAKIDSTDPSYLNNTERIELMCTSIAKETNNKYALDEYAKPDRYFGFM